MGLQIAAIFLLLGVVLQANASPSEHECSERYDICKAEFEPFVDLTEADEFKRGCRLATSVRGCMTDCTHAADDSDSGSAENAMVAAVKNFCEDGATWKKDVSAYHSVCFDTSYFTDCAKAQAAHIENIVMSYRGVQSIDEDSMCPIVRLVWGCGEGCSINNFPLGSDVFFILLNSIPECRD